MTTYILSAAFIVTLGLFFLHYRMLNAELNAREQAEASLRTLSVRLLELQDQERRRFSRELHDSLGQYLVGVKMNLTMLGNSVPSNALISECIKLLDQAMTETRTISHLLHPPLLDETGFASAARWYVEGFAKRSGIQTSLDMPEDWPPAQFARAGAFPRPAGKPDQRSSPFQEPGGGGLLNGVDGQVVLRVRDYGKGIPADVLDRFRRKRAHGGVGLAGMRERINELGGRLEMDSDSHGTRVWQLCRAWSEEALPGSRRRLILCGSDTPQGTLSAAFEFAFANVKKTKPGSKKPRLKHKIKIESLKSESKSKASDRSVRPISVHSFLLRSLDMPPAAGT